MDPLSLSATAAALVTICVQAIQIMKQTIETIRKAKTLLLRLLSQTERVRIFLEQLRSFTAQLGPKAGILLAFNDSGPRETIEELHVFVQEMAQKSTWIRVKVLLNRSVADKFVERLHRHEEEIMQVLQFTMTALAIGIEEEIRKMREDAVLHSRIMSPFSSKPPALVIAPDLEVDKLKTRVSEMEIGGPSLADDWNEYPKSHRPELAAGETSSFHNTESSSSQTLFDETDEYITPHISNPGHTPSLLEDPQGAGQISGPESALLEPDLFSSDGGIEEQQLDKLQVWFGDLSRSGFDRKYLSLRDGLSNAAYSGRFNTLFQVLADVEEAYGQSWANAPRLSSTFKKSSGWTPLHQAVFMGASSEHINSLVQDYGALRMAPLYTCCCSIWCSFATISSTNAVHLGLLHTAWTNAYELPHRKMTAFEMAMALGREELSAILSPEILYPVSHQILAMLQTHFHNLIRSNLAARPHELAALRLPDLKVLTELEPPIMWFPLKSREPLERSRVKLESAKEVRKRVRGYLYRLDREELLVKIFDIEDEEVKMYRISEVGSMEISTAISFHV